MQVEVLDKGVISSRVRILSSDVYCSDACLMQELDIRPVNLRGTGRIFQLEVVVSTKPPKPPVDEIWLKIYCVTFDTTSGYWPVEGHIRSPNNVACQPRFEA